MSEQNPPGGPPAPKTGPPRIQLQLDEEMAQGMYTNLVVINHTQNEFVLDFAFFPPGAARAKVRARVISSPQHTKRLLKALEKNLEKYEERFGEIETGGQEEPLVH